MYAFSGRLQCTDNAPNIVLGSTSEYWLNPHTGRLDAGDEPRSIGSAVVPARHIQRVCRLTAQTLPQK
jgi:small nuclear ribonucleoprotein (snRNP)-like protein